MTSRGRSEVPVASPVELYETVQRERESGSRRRHALESAMAAGRARALRLQPRKLVPEALDDVSGHRRSELRSLAYHRALARRLRRSMADEALRLIWQWREAEMIDPRRADEWEDVLRLPLSELRKRIGEDTAHGRDLRQSSPFAGLLSEPERRRIIAEIR